MLVHAVMDLLRGSLTVVPEKDERKKEEKRMLMSLEVWSKAQNLLAKLDSHLKGTCTLTELQDLYDRFVTFLEALRVEKLPAEFLEIKRNAHKVMRPYHSQTLQLVSQCRTLAGYFLKYNNAKNLEALVAALEAAVNALKEATNAINKIEQHTESAAAVKAFANARAEIEKCFKQYDLESGASERSKNMEMAQKKDKERLEQLNTRFSKGDTSKPASLSLIKVTLKVNGKPDVTYETEDTTALSAILWKRAQNEPSLLQGHFEHIASGKRERERIGHNNQVKQIGGTGSTRILYLVSA
ncbi:hypothetical protein PILCRDRAFT_634896 [Piloderma croceum F 1598]|uniref:Uncharacterized protein n=1 Tax=Piloderma croceum (strain F 1598) TaxID=765440 RepID=A0A0C3FB04_PILCF|nr:hypothetical protein PILCRDRAFT_634896 [Piloderma croceum F 1598]